MPTSQNANWVQGWLAAMLALVAGYVDAFTFLNFQVYGSFMSGNTTQTGLLAGEGKLADAAYNFLPIPLFVAGVFAGTLLVHTSLGHRLRLLFGSVAALLLAAMASVLLGPLPNWADIVILSLAMGIMNTAVTSVGTQTVAPGYVSGTLNHLAQQLSFALTGAPPSQQLPEGETHWGRAGLLASIWLAFVSGALLAGLLMPRLAVWSLAIPLAIVMAFALSKRIEGLEPL